MRVLVVVVGDEPIVDVPEWQQWNLGLSLNAENWKTTLFIDNVTDERIILSRWNTFFVEPRRSFFHDRVAPPRRVGLRFTYSF